MTRASMKGRDLFLAGVGLAAIFVQLPIVKMVLDDPQSLSVGVWNNPTFLVFSLLTFGIIPAVLGLALLVVWKLYPKTCWLLLAMGISFLVVAQFNYHYLKYYFVHAPWRHPLCAGLFLLPLVPLIRYRETVVRMLKVSGLFGVAIFAFFAAQAAPARLAMALPQASFAPLPESPPVFFLTFEKLVASYLADEQGRILADRFPNVARFVQDADYYPQAYANQTATAYALKTLYSGRYWTREKNWLASPTLISILGAGRRTYVLSEMLPKYCRPPATCIRTVGQKNFTSRALLIAWYKTYLISILPDPLEARLIRTLGWRESFDVVRDFWELETDTHASVGLRQMERLKETIQANGEAPALYVMHNFMSYDSPVTTSALRGDAQTASERLQELERARDALRPFDAALGALLDQLKACGLYDRSLILITSDTGYDPFMRAVEGMDAELPVGPDLVRIFLAIKRPGQRAGRIFSAPIQQVDVLPTILHDLGIDPEPFHFAGMAVTNPEQTWDLAQRPLKLVITSASGIRYYLLTHPQGPLRKTQRF